jgi:hypothetical protein
LIDAYKHISTHSQKKKEKKNTNKMPMQVETHGPGLNCASAKPAQNEEFSTL